MSAALNPSRRDRFSSKRARTRTISPDSFRATPSSSDSIKRLPSQDEVPGWVRSLLLTQQISVVATFVLAGSVLVVYGWTVYAQQIWGKEYQHLETLRRNERQLTTKTEMLKDQIAKVGDRPGTTLAPQSPDSLIFLKPAPSRGSASPSTSTASPQVSPMTPLGY
jgi:hypothetical protein